MEMICAVTGTMCLCLFAGGLAEMSGCSKAYISCILFFALLSGVIFLVTLGGILL